MAAPASPQFVTQVKDIRVPRISKPPLLEEFVTGAGRADMFRIDDFRQRDPGDGVPISRATVAWIGYDEHNFYAVFRCASPAGHTRARLSKREDIFSDDFVGLFLDTYHDRQRSYEFFVNPFGIQGDAIVAEGQDDDFSFDTLWYSSGRLTPEGFVTMMAIPFKSLRFTAEDVQTWGFGVARFIRETNENAFWPFVTHKVQGFNQQLGNLTGLEGISPGRNLRLTPYGAFGRSHFLDIPSSGPPLFRSDTAHRAGLDAKAVIHDTFTLDVTVNPDFSQVESDDPQVTANQRYEVQFSEKRPFFLENNSYFLTPETLFFSRRIIDPEYGARLTGKVGRWNLGALAIDDRATGTEDRAVAGVLRVDREFQRQSHVGILFTDRELNGTFNRVGATDIRLKLSDHWVFDGQAISSISRNGDGHESGGDAFQASINGQSRDWYYDLRYIDRAEGFRADLGFVPRVNLRQFRQNLTRRWHRDTGRILSVRAQLYAVGDFDHRNLQQDWTVRPEVSIEMPGNTYLSAFGEKVFERFDGINFLRNNFGGEFRSEYFRKISFDAGYAHGGRINYDPAVGVRAFRGGGSELQTSFTIRPTSRMKLDEIYYLTRLYTSDGHAVFLNHLARSRLNYQFTRELSLRLILDYNSVLQNPALISLEKQKRITGDVLFTWFLHPGTAFYLGYTDRRENLAIFSGSTPYLDRIGFPSTTTGRQFFAKLSYQLRF